MTTAAAIIGMVASVARVVPSGEITVPHVAGVTANVVVPENVYFVHAAGIGGGGGGAGSSGVTFYNGGGGGGGALVAVNNIAVTPGETLTVSIGSGGNLGAPNSFGTTGGNTQITSGTTVLLRAGGGVRGTVKNFSTASNGVGGSGGAAYVAPGIGTVSVAYSGSAGSAPSGGTLSGGGGAAATWTGVTGSSGFDGHWQFTDRDGCTRWCGGGGGGGTSIDYTDSTLGTSRPYTSVTSSGYSYGRAGYGSQGGADGLGYTLGASGYTAGKRGGGSGGGGGGAVYRNGTGSGGAGEAGAAKIIFGAGRSILAVGHP